MFKSSSGQNKQYKLVTTARKILYNNKFLGFYGLSATRILIFIAKALQGKAKNHRKYIPRGNDCNAIINGLLRFITDGDVSNQLCCGFMLLFLNR